MPVSPPAPPLPCPSPRIGRVLFTSPGEKLDERATIERIRQQWASGKRSNGQVAARIHYTHVEPILQDGPMCGIVALAMIASQVCKYTANDIFQMALNKEYTLRGEMFNASDMYALAHAVAGEYFDIAMITNGLKDKENAIIEDLMKGSLYLVPYDADKNNSPGLFFGHRAHWALLCGVIEEGNGKWVILARQGKSRHVCLWAFDDLLRSNANLIGISPGRLTEVVSFLKRMLLYLSHSNWIYFFDLIQRETLYRGYYEVGVGIATVKTALATWGNKYEL